jgi:hypothetical protein
VTTLRLNPALAKACHVPDAPRTGTAPPAPPCGNALGDWALALVHTRPQKLVIAVSSLTHWAFCLPYAPMPTLQSRFGPALLQALLSLGVPPDRARAEIDHSEPWILGRGIDRRTVGHLTQYRHSVTWAAGEGLSLGAINARLADHLVLRPREGYPAEEVLRLLGGNPALVAPAPERQERPVAQGPMTMRRHRSGARKCTSRWHWPCPTSPRLEAAHQATILLMRLPHDDGVSGPPSRTGNPRGRWIPRTLVIDFADVDSASPTFARALLGRGGDARGAQPAPGQRRARRARSVRAGIPRYFPVTTRR